MRLEIDHVLTSTVSASQSAGSAPKFTAKPAIRQTATGVLFEVRLLADPAPQITWYHGETVINDGGRYKITTQTDGANYTLVLELSSISGADGGAYKVTAKNKLGQSNANINLNLEGEWPGKLIGAISISFGGITKVSLHVECPTA